MGLGRVLGSLSTREHGWGRKINVAQTGQGASSLGLDTVLVIAWAIAGVRDSLIGVAAKVSDDTGELVQGQVVTYTDNMLGKIGDLAPRVGGVDGCAPRVSERVRSSESGDDKVDIGSPASRPIPGSG